MFFLLSFSDHSLYINLMTRNNYVKLVKSQECYGLCYLVGVCDKNPKIHENYFQFCKTNNIL